MGDTELLEKLNATKKALIANSKDAHFAKSMIEDLLSIKGQLTIKPLALDCGKVIDELKGDVFRITLTDKGVLYHEYGGYSVFATPNITGVYENLSDLVANKEENNKLEGEEKEKLETSVAVLLDVINTPKLALQDAELTFDVANLIVKYLVKKYDELMSQSLNDETVEADEEFKKASIALEQLKGSLKE